MKTYARHAMITVMLPRIVATVSLASLCLLSFILTFTSPASAGPLGLLALYVTAYLTFVGLISFFLFGTSRLIVALSAGMTFRKPLRALPFKRAYYLSTVLATAPVMLVGLQSVQTVGIYEILLVLLFQIVACVYVARRAS